MKRALVHYSLYVRTPVCKYKVCSVYCWTGVSVRSVLLRGQDQQNMCSKTAIVQASHHKGPRYGAVALWLLTPCPHALGPGSRLSEVLQAGILARSPQFPNHTRNFGILKTIVFPSSTLSSVYTAVQIPQEARPSFSGRVAAKHELVRKFRAGATGGTKPNGSR